MDDPDEPPDRRARVGDRADAAAGRTGAVPCPEQALDHADDILGAEVAADDEGGSCRMEHPPVDRAELVRRQALDGLARPARRPVIGRARGVDRPDEGLFDAPARIGLGLQQVVEPLVAEPVDLGAGKVGRRRTSATRSRAGARRSAGTSTPTLSASQPASAWIEAPSRSVASTRAMAS